MRPRSLNRGNGPVRSTSDATVRASFNEAAVSQPRKHLHARPSARWRTGFNEAAVSQPRKHRLSDQRSERKARFNEAAVSQRRCCTARSKSLTSLCRSESHPAQ